MEEELLEDELLSKPPLEASSEEVVELSKADELFKTDELLMLSELSEDELSPQATAASVNAQEQESKNAIKVFFIITP